MKQRIHVGRLDIASDVVAKLCQKHGISEDEVRALIEWPAVVRAAYDDDDLHGPRWLALVFTSGGDRFFAVLDPVPPWEGENADTWRLRTAYWL